MPYNTRRKSLSLTELGIVLPKRNRTQSHPSPPSTIVEGEENERPTKKSRLMSPPEHTPAHTTTIRFKEEPKPAAAQLSPPPSPAAEGSHKVDLEGVGDDIVIGTIEQLERTGNRPIFVRELAAVLATRLHSVEKSANPSALISSRLTSYLNRPWPAISPCPLAKDLSPVHPRRLYFYLTTMPRQPVPEHVDLPKMHRIISPSLSSASAADEEDERFDRSRQALSPSPEVDLSSPELDNDTVQEPPTPGRPFSGRNSVARERSASASQMTNNRRAASPQLEHEERDFKQTANALYEQAQQRRNSQLSQQDVSMEQADATAGAEQDTASVSMSIEDSEESTALKNSEAVADLFGHVEHLKTMELFSSPLMEPQGGLRIATEIASDEKHDEPMEPMALDIGSHQKDLAVLADWDTLQSPENVELAELDDMFDAY